MNGKERIDPEGKYLHIGYNHLVQAARVVAILAPGTSPLKKLRDRAAAEGRLLEVNKGRRTRSILIMDSNHVILSAVAPETLWRRAGGLRPEGAE